METSQTGQYLAMGLTQGPILLFALLQNPTRPLRTSPLRTFKGHTSDVLQLRFSSDELLASASMDRTVRLWHPHSTHCLRRLVHTDMVTSVAFHPREANYLLTAGCDHAARVWRLSDQAVVQTRNASSVLTATGFLPDGRAVVGTYDGRISAIVAGSHAHPSGMQEIVRARARARRPRTDVKVTGLVQTVDGLHAVYADGKMMTMGEDGVQTRLRAPVRKEGFAVGVSADQDGSFVVLDGVDGSVRVADLRGRQARKGGKETAVGVVSCDVLNDVGVTCALLVSAAVRRRCGLDDEEPGFYLLVGGEDGGLHFVRQDLNR